MDDDYVLDKVLDNIKKTALHNLMISTFVINDGDKFCPQVLLEEELHGK